jgi:lipopolysaccharide transport system ATP-binding protein
MKDIAIRVTNLSKCYQIYDTPRDRLKQFVLPRLRRMMGKAPKQYFGEFWALKDVSFEVKKGETVGIIGRNGSGKSTLLQMICGTLNPTSGDIQTTGRIAALLELGSGFNPEFTGRENVYMNASVLGLSTEETDARFDDIVAFADIGDFVEQPVKTYSSGMVVRLAFSVAINIDPEILIVDEALSVGDELFQRKCFSRIEAIRANGATILFVSHSGWQIIELCDRAILMDAGEKIAVGVPKKIVGQYQKFLYAPQDKRDILREQIRQLGGNYDTQSAAANIDPSLQSTLVNHHDGSQEYFDPSLKPTSTIEYESQGAQIENPHIVDLAGKQVNNLIRGGEYRYTYTVKFCQNVNNVRFGMMIKTISGIELGGCVTSEGGLAFVKAGTAFNVRITFTCTLNAGVFFLNAGVIGENQGQSGYLHRLVDIAMFRVLADTLSFAIGTVDFGCLPEVSEVQESEATC